MAMAEELNSSMALTAVPPQNQETWHQLTERNMIQSRNQVRDMLTRCRQNEAMEAANRAAAQDFANREKEAAKRAVFSKAAAHGKVIDTAFKCMQDIEDATLQMEDSATKLKHERMQGFAALQVCTRRIELREKRPAPETFHDTLAEALAGERKALEAFRAELFNMEAEAKKVIDDLAAMRRFLSQDTGERRLEMMHDISSLKPNLAPAAATQQGAPGAPGSEGNDGAAAPAAQEEQPPARPPPPTAEAAQPKAAEAAPAGAAPAEGETAASREEKMQSKALIEATQKLLHRALTLRSNSFVLIDRVKQESSRALVRTEDALARRTVELAVKKKGLETHQLDVEAAITTAERSLERMQRRLDPKDKVKAAKLASDQSALEQLRVSRLLLQEDIRNKFAALELDNLCRRVTPAKADSAKRQSAMARTSSAPSLRGTKKDTASSFSGGFGITGNFDLEALESTRVPASAVKPASPPGGSSSLKAGSAAGLH